MKLFLELAGNPVVGLLLILFVPLGIALIYRAWHGDGPDR